MGVPLQAQIPLQPSDMLLGRLWALGMPLCASPGVPSLWGVFAAALQPAGWAMPGVPCRNGTAAPLCLMPGLQGPWWAVATL